MKTKDELKAALQQLSEDEAMPYLYEVTQALERQEAAQRAEFLERYGQLTPGQRAMIAAKIDELLTRSAAF